VEQLQRRPAAVHGDRLHPPAAEHVDQDPAVGSVVVDDQHRQADQAQAPGPHPGQRPGRPAEPRGEVEGTPPAGLALGPDPPAHQLDEPHADGQSQPGPAVLPSGRAVGLDERLEDGPELLRGDADPGVGHTEVELRPAVVGRSREGDADHHFAAVGELGGVADQIVDDLPEAAHVPDEPVRDVVVDLAGDLESLPLRTHRDRLEGVPQDVAQGERGGVEVELAGLDLGEVEDVVDDGEERIGRRLDQLQVLALRPGEVGPEGELGHPDDAVHRGADLVAHVRQELPPRLVRGLGRFLGLVQLGGHPLPVGDPDERHDRPGHPPVLPAGRVGPVLHREAGPVGPPEHLVVGVDLPADPEGAVAEGQLLHVAAEQVGRAGVAQEPDAGGVAEDADPVRVDAEDRLHGRVEQQLELLLEADLPGRHLDRHRAERPGQLGDLVAPPGGREPVRELAAAARRQGVARGEPAGAGGQPAERVGDVAHEGGCGQHAGDEQEREHGEHLPDAAPDGRADRGAVHPDVDVPDPTGQNGAAHVDAVADTGDLRPPGDGPVRVAGEGRHLTRDARHERVRDDLPPGVRDQDVGEAVGRVPPLVDHRLDGGRVVVEEHLDAGAGDVLGHAPPARLELRRQCPVGLPGQEGGQPRAGGGEQADQNQERPGEEP
jgi:hypothetical protein